MGAGARHSAALYAMIELFDHLNSRIKILLGGFNFHACPSRR